MIALLLLGSKLYLPPGTGSDDADAPPPPPPGAVPFLRSPFEGEHPLANFMDHGPRNDGFQLTHVGTRTFGIDGHDGHDFTMPEGTPLYAMADGVVLKAGDLGSIRCPNGTRAPHNVVVRILHRDAPDGNDYVTVLLHLSRVAVEPGDLVTAGQLVGWSGNTGCSTGPHLHLGVVRVTNTAKSDGYTIDPYGWQGEGDDPRAANGRVSTWMWKEGEAPPLRRRSKAQPQMRGTVGPHRLLATDGLDPIGGEWVDVGVRRTATEPVRLAGLVLTNRAGDRFALPDRTLAPGESLRVWTRKARPSDDGVSWGLDHEAWDDAGDCAQLLDADGRLVAVLRFGPPGEGCRLEEGAPEEAPEEAPEPDETRTH